MAAAMRSDVKTALMLAPSVLLLGGLFGGGLGLALLGALGYAPALGRITFSLQAFEATFANPAFGQALGLSLYIALASTLVSAFLGMGAALLLRRSFAGRGAALFLFQLNLTVPHLVGAIGMLYLLSQSGVFARLAFAIGSIAAPADFPALVYDPAALGIIAVYVWKEVPFIGLILLASLQNIGPDYEAVARSHGAGPWRSFAHVTLPLIAPSWIAASLIVFAYAFGAYEVPLVLGQNHPAALPVLAYRAYVDADLAARPHALAMSLVIAAISGALVALYLWVLRARGWAA